MGTGLQIIGGMSLENEIKRLVEEDAPAAPVAGDLDVSNDWSPIRWFNTSTRNTQQHEPMELPQFEMYDFDEEAKKRAA